MKKLVLFLLVAVGTYAQSTINGNRTFLGSVNATTATETQPFKAGVLADRPATCSIADTYFATDGTPGSNIYICTSANTWTQITGGGSGTVTNFTAGDLSPLFTSSVANPTSTPALTFTLTSQSANTVFAGPNGSNGNPVFRALVGGDIPAIDLGKTGNGGVTAIPTFTAGSNMTITGTWPNLTFAATSSGSSATFQANGTNLSSQSTINFENSAATDGLTLTFSNPSAGNVQLGLTGQLSNAGLANSSITIAGHSVSLGGSQTINFSDLAGTIAASQIAGSPVTNDCPYYTGTAMGWTTCGSSGGSYTFSAPLLNTSGTVSLTLGPSGGLEVTDNALDINTAVVPQLGTPNIFTALDTFQAGLNLLTTNTQPACASGTRGDLWFVNGGSSADSLETCEYNGSAYAWTSGGGSSGITALTGDVTASGSGSVAATLATVNSGPGQCGDATHVCQVTTNGKGLVTSQQAVAISGTGGAATSLVDANGESVITTNTAFSPVNYLTAGNAATGSPVTLTAAGSDANISINLIPKGTGTVECNGATCGGGFTGTAGSVPFVGTGGTLTQDNANLFWDDAHHVLSVATNNNSELISHMDTGIELYANGSNYGRGGLFLTGQAGGGYAFSNSSYNSNFCFSSNNFVSCLIAVNPSISSTNLYFDATNSEGANAAFSILAGSEGGHIYTHGTAPTISGTNCYAGKVAAIIGSATVTNGSESITVGLTTGVATGQVVGDDAGDIPQGATVTAVSGTTITISVTATGSSTTDNLTFIDTTSASNDDDGFVATVASATPRSCTVTFATPWTATQSGPVCTASSSIGNPGVSATQTSLTLSQSSSSASSMAYRCTGTN